MAMRLHSRLALAVVAVTVWMHGPGQAFAGDDFPEGTRYMTTEELWKIYHNRSWIWKDGAGYFPNAKRRFSAYSKSGQDASYAEGIWFLTWMGKACFRARWVGVDYDVPKLSCYSHRTDGRKIYQKRVPDGEWYVFKNDPVSSGDEFTKFVLGDFVSSGLKRNRRTIEENRKAGASGR